MARYRSTETNTTSNTDAVIDMLPKGQRNTLGILGQQEEVAKIESKKI